MGFQPQNISKRASVRLLDFISLYPESATEKCPSPDLCPNHRQYSGFL